MIQDAQNHVHCSKCYKVAECNSVTDCKIVTCSNRQCGARMHECKLDEHLNEICWYQFTECINKCNGCKLKIKRIDMSQHLKCCCASVIRCSSFRLRNLWNKNEKFQKLKWPCPIQLEYERNSKSIVDSTNVSKPQNMSDILLKQDYESIRKLAADSPLIFHRLYGYLIGLDVSSDFSRGRFSFLRKILKNVKSKIFPDIEAENCVILNDETGCLACQYRIRHLERKRFRETRTFENRIKFYSVLGELDDYATFVEEKIYEKPAFIKIYSNVFLAEKETKETVHHELPSFSKAEIDSKLLENNREILQVLELNPVLKVNITKEMACESFIEYESYRLKETTYTSHCDLFLRRDEFQEHYLLFHNFLLPNADQIHFSCPFKQYGCNFFCQKFDFLFGGCANSNPYASLVENDLTKCISFKVDYFYNTFWDENNNNVSKLESNKYTDDAKTLMDLPFEVMFAIIDNLDALSLYNLSMTCKDLRVICEQFLQLRGIVYPNWIKIESYNPNREYNEHGEDVTKNLVNWKIDRYSYTFSKHIHNPTEIRFKSNLPFDEYSKHFLTCPYRKINKLTDKFRIYPPLVKL